MSEAHPAGKRSGQAMIESVIAILVVSLVFLILFRLSFLLTGKIFLQHAAMRAARARSVGMNEFQCLKAARIAALPASGKRLWPEGKEFDTAMEAGRFGNYLMARNGAAARGILDYERWATLTVREGDGSDVRTAMDFKLFDDDEEAKTIRLDGRAGIEPNYPLYLNDQGL